MAQAARVILALLLFAVPASAQMTEQKVADWVSTGLVGVNLTAETIHDVQHHCVKNLILRNVLTIGASEGVKLIVHEWRPDHSDQKAFWSEHSAVAMANAGWNYSVGFSIALGAGAGRVIAQKHYTHDVLVGLLAGFGAGYLFPCN
jgi:membrane-associated phospholipid phosphatase